MMEAWLQRLQRRPIKCPRKRLGSWQRLGFTNDMNRLAGATELSCLADSDPWWSSQLHSTGLADGWEAGHSSLAGVAPGRQVGQLQVEDGPGQPELVLEQPLVGGRGVGVHLALEAHLVPEVPDDVMWGDLEHRGVFNIQAITGHVFSLGITSEAGNFLEVKISVYPEDDLPGSPPLHQLLH